MPLFFASLVPLFFVSLVPLFFGIDIFPVNSRIKWCFDVLFFLTSLVPLFLGVGF